MIDDDIRQGYLSSVELDNETRNKREVMERILSRKYKEFFASLDVPEREIAYNAIKTFFERGED